jgi:hypothetical protein
VTDAFIGVPTREVGEGSLNQYGDTGLDQQHAERYPNPKRVVAVLVA